MGPNAASEFNRAISSDSSNREYVVDHFFKLDAAVILQPPLEERDGLTELPLREVMLRVAKTHASVSVCSDGGSRSTTDACVLIQKATGKQIALSLLCSQKAYSNHDRTCVIHQLVT